MVNGFHMGLDGKETPIVVIEKILNNPPDTSVSFTGPHVFCVGKQSPGVFLENTILDMNVVDVLFNLLIELPGILFFRGGILSIIPGVDGVSSVEDQLEGGGIDLLQEEEGVVRAKTAEVHAVLMEIHDPVVFAHFNQGGKVLNHQIPDFFGVGLLVQEDGKGHPPEVLTIQLFHSGDGPGQLFDILINIYLLPYVPTPVGDLAAETVDLNTGFFKTILYMQELFIGNIMDIFSVDVSGFDVIPTEGLGHSDLSFDIGAGFIGKTCEFIIQHFSLLSVIWKNLHWDRLQQHHFSQR